MTAPSPFEIELRPASAKGALRARYRLQVRNTGDRVLRLEVDAQEPQRLTRISVEPRHVRVAPGETKDVVVTVRPDKRSWLAVPLRIPFTAQAQEMFNIGALDGEESTPPARAQATFEQRELLSKPTLAVVALALVAGVAFGYRPVKDALAGDDGATTASIVASTTTVPIGGTKAPTTTLERGDLTIYVRAVLNADKAKLNELRSEIEAVLKLEGLGYPLNIKTAPKNPALSVLVIEGVPDRRVAGICQAIWNETEVSTSECKLDPDQVAGPAGSSSVTGSR